MHYIWLQGWQYAPPKVRERVEKNSELWTQAGASKVHLWDEDGISKLLSTNTRVLHWFKGLQTTIAKCDVGRAIILEAHGGIYADADFDPSPRGIRAMWKEATETKKALFPADKSMGLVNNYLIASVRQSPFWSQIYIPAVAAAIESPSAYDAAMALLRPTWPVLSTHGPILISRLCVKFPSIASASLSVQTSELGFHGWRGGDSAWYTTKTERFQRRAALVTLLIAIWGVLLTLFLAGRLIFVEASTSI